MVECLTLDRGVAGSSLIGGTMLCPSSKTIYPLISTDSTQEDPYRHDYKVLTGK